MTRYVLEVEAHQWMKHGDHPEDGPPDSKNLLVQRFDHPEYPPLDTCPMCKSPNAMHGLLMQSDSDGHRVCPGDFVVHQPAMGYYCVDPKTFLSMYQELH